MESRAHQGELSATNKMTMELMAFASEVSERNKNKPEKDEALLSLTGLCPIQANNILIIGGGAGVREGMLLKRLQLHPKGSGTITCVDPHYPERIKGFFPSRDLLHIPAPIEQAIGLITEKAYDCIVCLGASRYLENPDHLLGAIFSGIPAGAIAIVDYLRIGSLKYAVNMEIRAQLQAAYNKSPSAMWELIDDLVGISIAIGKGLQGADSVEVRSNLFTKSGKMHVHQVLYDDLLPFWYRKGASRDLCKTLLIWNVLCTSPPGISASTVALSHSSMSMRPIEVLSPEESNTITILSKKE
jgi:hypothetical protein